MRYDKTMLKFYIEKFQNNLFTMNWFIISNAKEDYNII